MLEEMESSKQRVVGDCASLMTINETKKLLYEYYIYKAVILAIFDDDENRKVKITVWWDFEDCSILVGVKVHRVSNRITWDIRSSSIKGLALAYNSGSARLHWRLSFPCSFQWEEPSASTFLLDIW
ncbi:hypothetical protein MA16_Dca002155 [Dendrobium catenatum]|uniref:Uncharacterized protein n=1 Tax=Dendrobium catenatum TaxID=906689 RepID=A0A2I0XEJ9_9ASPA|nr:hypothetical protein MA16_Dca002155 [Dendrobium catenatum]